MRLIAPLIADVDFIKHVKAVLSTRTAPSGACVNILGHKNHKGYGTITFRGRGIKAHRAAWVAAHGSDIPGNLMVCHSCDNPSCVNPEHLFLGTNSDNMRDCYRKGRVKNLERGLECRRANPPTHCKHGHELAGKNLYLYPNGNRSCRTCSNRRSRVRRGMRLRKVAA